MDLEGLKIEPVVRLNHTPGIYDISNDEYHNSHAISRSMLMDFKKNPYYYWYKYHSGKFEKESPTSVMNLGSAVHTLVLEPIKFDSQFHIIHQKTRPKRGTAPYARMIKEARGKIILINSEYLQAFAMAKSILDNAEAYALLLDSKIEQSIFFKHESTGLMCKTRPDAWANGLVIDVKTSADARLKSFQSSCINFGYFLQAGMMHEGLRQIGQPMKQFAFIVVEKEPPYSVAIYTLSDDCLDYGINQFHALIEGLNKCIESDKWPSYGIRELKLPRFALFDELPEIE